MVTATAGRQVVLLDRRTAFLCVAVLFATWPPPTQADQRPLAVRVVSPQMNADVGADPTIVLAAKADAQGDGIAKVEFFDGARQLGEITEGRPQFTATDLTPGFHVFSVLGTDPNGDIQTSNPVLVVVRRPPTNGDADKQ